MIKDEKTLDVIKEVLIIFVWMIVALAWDGAISTIISGIKSLFPEGASWIVDVFLTFLYAIIVTVLALFAVVYVLKKLDYTETEEENKENQPKTN